MANYKFFESHKPDGTSDQTTTIIRTDVTPNLFIPFNDANGDYLKYLEWVAEGNTPDPAD
tara:strand:+ start:1834 stop:2013 length:180 start_codon:yes stop_codon:yes gene_type:complete